MNAVRGSGIVTAAFLACVLWAGKAVFAPAPHLFALGRAASPPLQALVAQAQPNAQKSQTPHPNQKKSAQNRNLGDWLREHKDLPLEQQEKLLESDPHFRQLAPDRQAALKDRLRKFNSLPPQQRERALQRMQIMAKLTPDQRKQIREANQQLETLPPQRRVMVHASLRKLRQMPPAQREQELQSPEFRNTFSDQEQNIIRQLASIEVPSEAEQQPSPGLQQPK